jgi:hypothetical protein
VTIEFSEVAVPDTAPPTDDAPPTAFEYACQTCGVELHYAGKGRKPRFCAEHKKNAPKGGVRSKGQNAQLAAQASDTIVQYTHLLAIGCTLTGYTDTEEAISDRQELLRVQCYEALVTNPARARAIIKLGGGSSDLGLAMAIGMFATAVGSTAMNEYKDKRKAREEQE